MQNKKLLIAFVCLGFFSSMTYAAGGSLWGDIDSEDQQIDSSLAPASEAPPIEEDYDVGADDDSPDIPENAKEPVTIAPSTPAPNTPPPVTDPTAVPTQAPGKKIPATTKGAKNIKGKAPAKAGTATKNKTTAPAQPTALPTVCEILSQQVSLNSGQGAARLQEEALRQSKVVSDEYQMLLSTPEAANNLYSKYRELYLKTNCKKIN